MAGLVKIQPVCNPNKLASNQFYITKILTNYALLKQKALSHIKYIPINPPIVPFQPYTRMSVQIKHKDIPCYVLVINGNKF